MSLPPAAPVWMVAIGCVVAILLGKLEFGDPGYNPFKPALAARVVLLIAFPVRMTTWSPPVGLFTSLPDAVTATTGTMLAARGVNLLDGLVGHLPGSVGETSVIALAMGGVFLLWRRVITWHVPISFIGGVAATAALFAYVNPDRFPGAGFHLVTGGLFLGAIFLATDYVASTVTPRGMLIYGAGCGLLTWLIRTFGGYPEGVSFAILLMNMLRPLIDRYTGRQALRET